MNLDHLPQPANHPVTAKVNDWTRAEPVIVSLAGAVLLAVAAWVASYLDSTLAETVFQLGTIIAMIAGAKYARDRVISVDTYDEHIGQVRHRAIMDGAYQAKRDIDQYLEADLASRQEHWENQEEAHDNNVGYEPLPSLGE